MAYGVTMKTKAELLQIIQDSTNDLAGLLAEESLARQVKSRIEPWKAKDYLYTEQFNRTRKWFLTRPTQGLANKAAAEVASYAKLLAYRDEFCPDYKFKFDEDNYCIYYDNTEQIYHIETYTSCKDLGRIYFDESTARKLCKALNNGSFTL